MKMRIRFGLVFLLMVLLTACGFLEKRRRVVIVLLDYSASSSDAVLNEYIRIITDDIFASLGENDCITVMPVDDGSVREPVKIIYEDFLQKKFVKKNDGFAHAQDSVQSRIDKYILQTKIRLAETLKSERTLRKSFLNSTDLLGALRQTVSLTETDENDGVMKKSLDFLGGRSRYKSENVIIILSDMIQDTHDCSFESKRALTIAQSSRFINGLKNSNKIPDFKNCKVFVNGTTGRNSIQIENVQAFWQEYFQTANAQLKAYGYNVEDKILKYFREKDY